jgi:hypothetical protein
MGISTPLHLAVGVRSLSGCGESTLLPPILDYAADAKEWVDWKVATTEGVMAAFNLAVFVLIWTRLVFTDRSPISPAVALRSGAAVNRLASVRARGALGLIGAGGMVVFALGHSP